ncbi:Hsp20/alpha crystallin family protein [Jiangella aurantiaca]|uniref:Hsp20/alpha crystallin family protein n=2 Tax=Jiangella aurantiaca TaxID=2530373 RepID=A0A4R5ABS1_9ACTN|nr:Hsp20/alpha crystallin family protein [Jiangella aurantiaca]
MIRVDEYKEGDTLVIRADLPGVDPDQDIDLDIVNGMLRLRAERRSEEDRESGGYLRRELRYGSFARTLPLPEGVTESDISASYKDGILEIRVPMPKPEPAQEPKRISIARG